MLYPDRRGAVDVLRLDDGKVNAMGPAWADAFHAAWDAVTANDRPVVLHSTAKAFGAGLDLKSVRSLDDAAFAAFAATFMRAFGRVAAYRRPVIAAVEGAALAGGAVLALACDFRVAGPRARMGVIEVAVGVPFPEPVLELVKLRLPPHEARHAVLAGAVREGPDLLARGWADRASAEGAALDEATALATELGAHAPLAYGMAKEWASRDALRAFAAFDAPAWARTFAHPDTSAALARTLEKLQRR